LIHKLPACNGIKTKLPEKEKLFSGSCFFVDALCPLEHNANGLLFKLFFSAADGNAPQNEHYTCKPCRNIAHIIHKGVAACYGHKLKPPLHKVKNKTCHLQQNEQGTAYDKPKSFVHTLPHYHSENIGGGVCQGGDDNACRKYAYRNYR